MKVLVHLLFLMRHYGCAESRKKFVVLHHLIDSGQAFSVLAGYDHVVSLQDTPVATVAAKRHQYCPISDSVQISA